MCITIEKADDLHRYMYHNVLCLAVKTESLSYFPRDAMVAPPAAAAAGPMSSPRRLKTCRLQVEHSHEEEICCADSLLVLTEKVHRTLTAKPS